MRFTAVIALLLSIGGGAVSAEDQLGPFATVKPGRGIVLAEYRDPLDSYPHRIMGRIREKDTLYLEDQFNTYTLTLSVQEPGHVFEDIRPHLGDLDGDGANDVAVVLTSLTQGASLAIYTIRDDRIVKIAQTPFIGRKNRWFAQAGIGDFNGDGRNEIAFVDRPHLARVIRFYGLVGGKFQEIASAGGVTNHAIGEEFIRGGVRNCGTRDQVVVTEAATGAVMALWIDPADGQVRGERVHPATKRDGIDLAMACR